MILPDNYHMMDQLTDEWFAYKNGRVSSSHMSDVMAGGTGKTRTNYLYRLVAEKLSGKSAPTFSNKHMDRGVEDEPIAREQYEFFNNVDVVEVGFIDHSEIENYGASTDGLVGEHGLLEIKSALPAIHME